MTDWHFDNTWARELGWLAVPTDPVPVADPQLVFANDELAGDLGLAGLHSPDTVAALAGNAVLPGSQPLAQAYAGHQFGVFNPLMGDGRAVLLGEVVDPNGGRWDVALKGSGRTRFARGGDGRAVLGPMLREALMGEAMHALGVPTTRALAVLATGERVLREQPLPGAVLARVAASHVRVGTMQLVRTQGSREQLEQVAEYVRARHFATLAPGDAAGLLSAVVSAQARLVAQWMSLGFIHGVMNTDNMALSGETIDYGPCAFLETHDPTTVFSSIDHAGRYRYENQPAIAAWNLARLAEALLPLIDDDADRAVEMATERVEAFFGEYETQRVQVYGRKLGITDVDAVADRELVDALLEHMTRERLDHTLTFTSLADALQGNETRLGEWEGAWRTRVGGIEPPVLTQRLSQANPAVVPRNHLVEEALGAAHRGDLAPFDALLAAVRDPFRARPADDPFTQPAPASFTRAYVTYCGT